MIADTLRSRAIWVGCLLVVLAAGCTGTPQLPDGGGDGEGQDAMRVLPTALSLDIDEFPEDSEAGDAGRRMNPPPAGHGRSLLIGCTVVHGFHRLLDAGLALAAGIHDDLDDLDGATLEGTLPVQGAEVAYKADFSAFDIDGDGTADGSGTAADLPTALRMWVDPDGDGVYERFLCALITSRISAGGVGAGQMYLYPAALVSGVSADFRCRVSWDRQTIDDGWNEAWVTGRLLDGYALSGGHARVDVATLEDSSVQKTVRATCTFSENRFGVTELRNAARGIRGTGMVLMNAEVTGGGLSAALNVCLDLVNLVVSPDGCDSIDTTDMDYLSAPVGDETDWPADFPETPTF